MCEVFITSPNTTYIRATLGRPLTIRYYSLILWVTALLFPNISLGDDFSLYSRIEGFSYTEPVGIKSFTSDWVGRYYGGTDAQLNYLIEFGARYRDWGIGYTKQEYLFMHFTQDSARFYYLSENKKPLQKDATKKIAG